MPRRGILRLTMLNFASEFVRRRQKSLRSKTLSSPLSPCNYHLRHNQRTSPPHGEKPLWPKQSLINSQKPSPRPV
jgi:hypothetical protein